jgi:CPA1 family monovalent cation:H+ antiporter
LIISWSGMRGIVSLAAALALPTGPSGGAFPFRELIVLTAFAVVLGTLVIQGLTLKPLLKVLNLHDDDPVGQEVALARERALQAALATLHGDPSPAARAVALEFAAHLRQAPAEERDGETGMSDHEAIHRRALDAARKVLLDLRASDGIGDDAFHALEEELDRIEMGSGTREAAEPRRDDREPTRRPRRS